TRDPVYAGVDGLAGHHGPPRGVAVEPPAGGGAWRGGGGFGGAARSFTHRPRPAGARRATPRAVAALPNPVRSVPGAVANSRYDRSPGLWRGFRRAGNAARQHRPHTCPLPGPAQSEPSGRLGVERGMTDGQDLDAIDEAILKQIRATYGRVDPPPADLDVRVQFGIALESVDIEVARLAEDLVVGSGARGSERTRTITFDSESVTIMISIIERG